jgi:hypothetical protein
MKIQHRVALHKPRLSTLFISLSITVLGACQDDNSNPIATGLTNPSSEIMAKQAPPDSCSTAQIADYAALVQSQQSLPNPFVLQDGTQVTTAQQWQSRQLEVAKQAQAYMLGELPQDHPIVSTVYHEDILSVTVTSADAAISFDAKVELPTTGQAPYPAMIGMGRVSLNRQALLDQGIALITFPNNDIAEQQNGSSRGKGKFYQLYGSDHSAGALMAWTWGVSRLNDAMALVAGAFEPRIVLTIPQESGAGGSANWRVSEANLAAGENVQTLRQIVTENVWFSRNFADFSETVNRLPFDQHQILGLVAPRALLIIDNAIDWLGIESSYTNAIAAKTIWQALGAADAMGVSQTLAHQHCQQPASQQAEINAFVQTYLLDKTDIDTQLEVNENAVDVDQARWITWTTPKLN